jgi:hypothetical protein
MTAVCKRQTAKQFATVQYCQKPLHLGFSYCQPLQGHQSAYCQSHTQRPSSPTNTCPSPFDTNSRPRLLRPVYNSPSQSHKSSIRSSTSPRHTSCSRSARTPFRQDYCRAAAWVAAAASFWSCSPAPTQPCSRCRNRARPAEAGFWARSGQPLTNSCELAADAGAGKGRGTHAAAVVVAAGTGARAFVAAGGAAGVDRWDAGGIRGGRLGAGFGGGRGGGHHSLPRLGGCVKEGGEGGLRDSRARRGPRTLPDNWSRSGRGCCRTWGFVSG